MRPLMLVGFNISFISFARSRSILLVIWTGYRPWMLDNFVIALIHTFCCLTVRSKNFHFSGDLLAHLCTHTPQSMHTTTRAAPSTDKRATKHVIHTHRRSQPVRRSVAKGTSSGIWAKPLASRICLRPSPSLYQHGGVCRLCRFRRFQDRRTSRHPL